MKANLPYALGGLFRLTWLTLLVIAILVLVKHFVFDIMPYSGLSMYPTFNDRDIAIVNKISYVIGAPRRGDTVVLRFPGDPDNTRYIKRIIGMPGEKVAIRDGIVYINGEKLRETYIPADIYTTPDMETQLTIDEYFLLGDNRPVSSDSRNWGKATKRDFIGKTFFIIYPFSEMRPVPDPAY